MDSRAKQSLSARRVCFDECCATQKSIFLKTDPTPMIFHGCIHVIRVFKMFTVWSEDKPQRGQEAIQKEKDRGWGLIKKLGGYDGNGGRLAPECNGGIMVRGERIKP